MGGPSEGQRTSIGLDVYARSVMGCGLDGDIGEVFSRRLCPDHREVLNWSDPRRTLARIKYRVVTLPKGLRNNRRRDQAYPGGDGWQMHINGSHESASWSTKSP